MTKLPLNRVPGKALERKLTQLSTETFLCFLPSAGMGGMLGGAWAVILEPWLRTTEQERTLMLDVNLCTCLTQEKHKGAGGVAQWSRVHTVLVRNFS